MAIPITQRQCGLCLVCGDTAIGINFAVLTCAPCKAFFRRNALKIGTTNFACQLDGDCPVTYQHRRGCSCCRLAKCFHAGMQKSLILSDHEKTARKELVQQNRQKRTQDQMMKRTNSIRPSNLLLLAHSKSKCLSLSDQTLLTNIISAYERTYIAARNSQPVHFPSQPYLSLHTLFNEYNNRHASLIEYFKLIPEFNRISINDKIRLLKNHFGTMFMINESRNRPDKHSTSFLALRNLYGIEIATNLYRCMELIYVYGHDPLLIQLLLLAHSLSSSISRNFSHTDMDHIYDDTKGILAGQNLYIELLWRYIVSRLPSEQDAVKFFNKLILDLLFMLRVGFVLDSFIYSFPDEIAQMELLMQSMWPNNQK